MLSKLDMTKIHSYEIRFKLKQNFEIIDTLLDKFKFNPEPIKDINILGFIDYVQSSFKSPELNKRINWIYNFSKIIMYKLSKLYLKYIRKFKDETVFDNPDLLDRVAEIIYLCENLYSRTDVSEETVELLLIEIYSLENIVRYVQFKDYPTQDSSDILEQMNSIVDFLKPLIGTNFIKIDSDTFLTIIRNISHLNHLLDYWKTIRDVEKALDLVYH